MAADDNLVCPDRVGAEPDYQVGEGIRIEEPISGQVLSTIETYFGTTWPALEEM